MRKVRAKGRAVTRTVKKRNKKIIKQRETSKPGIYGEKSLYISGFFVYSGAYQKGRKI